MNLFFEDMCMVCLVVVGVLMFRACVVGTFFQLNVDLLNVYLMF